MRIKTELGAAFLIVSTILVVIAIVIGQNNLSDDLGNIERSIQVSEKALAEE